MPWLVVTTTVHENAKTWQVVVSPDGSEESARQAARELEGLDGVDVQSITVIQAPNAAEAARLVGMPTAMALGSFPEPSQPDSSAQTNSS